MLVVCDWDLFSKKFFCRSSKPKRVTRVQLNKRARNKEQLKKKTEALKMKMLSKEIDRYDEFCYKKSLHRTGYYFFCLLFSFFVYLFIYFKWLCLLCYSLPDIMQEIAKEDEEKQKRRLRRLVSQQERLKTRPPRFGKHKYGSSLHDIISNCYNYSTWPYLLFIYKGLLLICD